MGLCMNHVDEATKFLKLDKSTLGLVFTQLYNDKATEISAYVKAKDEHPPFDDKSLAGGSFHDILLRLHKAMHAAAIQHCRPRLRSMMAQVYKSDAMLERLFGAGKAGGSIKEKFTRDAKQKAMAEIAMKRAKLLLLKEAYTKVIRETKIIR